MTRHHPDNPFVLAGLSNALQALQPKATGTQDEYYVDVDGTQQAFDDFVRAAGNVSDLVGSGRLIVVAGSKGCGKSSVLNRCVDWAEQNLNASVKFTPFIADLTRGPKTIETIPEAMERISKRVLDLLEDRSMLDHARCERLKSRHLADRLSGLSEALSTMSSENEKSTALLVLLPIQELREALVQFTELAFPGTLYFCERLPLDDPGDWQSQVSPDLPTPIEVSVGPLKPNDAQLFAETRLSAHTGGTIPSMHGAAMTRYQQTRGEMTIGDLQKLLVNLYDAALTEAMPEITYEFIADFFVKHAAGWQLP